MQIFIASLRQMWDIWFNFWVVYRTCGRIEDLKRLHAWAKRKRLTQVRDAYKAKCGRELNQLLAQQEDYPRITRFAVKAFQFINYLAPQPRYAKRYVTRYKTR